MRGQLIVLAVVVGQLLPLTAEAKTIHLKNGKALEGEVEATTEAEITVAIPGLGTMTFSRAEVEAIDDAPIKQEAAEQPGQVFLDGRWMSVEEARELSTSLARAKEAQQPSNYTPPDFTYFGTTEEAVRKAQQNLEYAIRHRAPKEEIERLRGVVRRWKQNLLNLEAAEKKMQERREADQRRIAEREQAKRAKALDGTAGGELGSRGKPVKFGSTPSLSVGALDSNGKPVTLTGQDARNFLNKQQESVICASSGC